MSQQRTHRPPPQKLAPHSSHTRARAHLVVEKYETTPRRGAHSYTINGYKPASIKRCQICVQLRVSAPATMTLTRCFCTRRNEVNPVRNRHRDHHQPHVLVGHQAADAQPSVVGWRVRLRHPQRHYR